MARVPKFLEEYFWGDDLSNLDTKKHKKYIAAKIMQLGDLEAIKWLKKNFNVSFLKKALNSKEIDKKSKNFWKLYFS